MVLGPLKAPSTPIFQAKRGPEKSGSLRKDLDRPCDPMAGQGHRDEGRVCKFDLASGADRTKGGDLREKRIVQQDDDRQKLRPCRFSYQSTQGCRERQR
jgi:hypothetical protein